MPKKQLNLFELPTSTLAQTGARPAQIVRRKLRNAGNFGRLLHHMPDCLCGDPRPQNPSSAAHATKDSPFSDIGRHQPFIEHRPDPLWNRHGPDVAPFSAQVHNCPVSLSLLNVGQFEFYRFMAASAHRPGARPAVRGPAYLLSGWRLESAKASDPAPRSASFRAVRRGS